MRETLKTLRERYPLLPALLSAGGSLAYAVFHGALAFRYRSWWSVTLAAYFCVLGCMRLSAVSAARSGRRAAADNLRRNGMAMALLAIVLSGMTLLTILEQRNAQYALPVILAIAAYTFCLAGLAIRNVIRAFRTRSSVMIALRNIACAGAIGAMLSLERAMLGTFGDAAGAFARTMEAASGAEAFVLVLALGAGMIAAARRAAWEDEAGETDKNGGAGPF